MKLARIVFLAITLVAISALRGSLILRYKIQVETEIQPIYEVTDAFPNHSFNRPVGVYHAGDGTNRLFVIEQPGEILLIENSENTQTSEVFLDIRDRVLCGGGRAVVVGVGVSPELRQQRPFLRRLHG
jgi:hypothetical protein